jgi:hypothetical protein
MVSGATIWVVVRRACSVRGARVATRARLTERARGLA